MHRSIIDIIAEKPFKFAGKNLLNASKDVKKDKESKKLCKIINFSSEWNFTDILTFIESIKAEEYPNLFIFIIHLSESTGGESGYEKLKDCLLKFGSDRPLIYQLIFTNKNVSKLFFKVNSTDQLRTLNFEEKTDFCENLNFSSFLSDYLFGEFEKIFEDFIKNFKSIEESSTILRFLRTLDFNDEFFMMLILKCAECGTKNDFTAVLDAPFHEGDKKLSHNAQKCLSTVINDDESDEESDDEASMNLARSRSKSVLLTAVEHKNKDVITYLVKFCSDFIQKLPFDHQLRISSVALETNQIDVLCDLLDIADFPFPEYFKPDDSQSNERLHQIIKFRADLIASVIEEDFDKVEELIKENLNLKIFYSINNNSILKEAINSNRLSVFYFLKTYGIKGDDYAELLDKISDKEKNKAARKAAAHRNLSASYGLKNNQQSVMMLSTKSYIHDKKIVREKESECRVKITNWYERINDVAPDILDVAVASEKLKIIYDFDSETVENVSLSGPNTAGSTYMSSHWIFIGAKITRRERELEITGVLAQQLCYYVLNIVFDNGGKPYYKDDNHLADIFDNIVKSIDVWSGQTTEPVDDECCGIISSVFTTYAEKDFHSELILRVVQILIEFGGDEDFLDHIKQKYKNLFNFWHDFVVPELQLSLQKETEIIKLNAYFGVLSKIKQQKIELLEPKDFKEILKDKIIIITTNVPTILLVDIYKYLKKEFGCLLDTQNIFADPEGYKSETIREDFQKYCKRKSSMCVYIDCSNRPLDNINITFANKKNKFIFIAENQAQRDELINVSLKVCRVNPKLLELNYNWLNLTTKSQKHLLKYKINFQNNESLSLLDVLGSPTDLQGDQSMQREFDIFAEIIDDMLLNLVIEGQKIPINSKLVEDLKDKKFEFLYKNMKLVRKEVDQPEDTEKPEITPDNVIKATKNKHFILISDVAGTGKTFALKNISKVLKNKYPTRWVSYIEITHFHEEIELQRTQTDFVTFLVEKILKLKRQFEIKIFKKLYNDCRVCIIIDGYDEIFPDYAEFVNKWIKSFELNGGNQMWISSRDFFEPELLQLFPINDVYKPGKFSRENGVELIAKCWLIAEQRDLEPENFDEIIKNSPQLESYLKVAEKVVKEIETLKIDKIMTAEDYKMASEAFKDGKFTNIDVEDPNLIINRYKIFLSFSFSFYKIWANEKGEVRRDANVKSQQYDLNFFGIHQFAVLYVFFPEQIKKLFPHVEENEWSHHEIVACGMMNYDKDGKSFFLSNNLRDFFGAELIVRELKRSCFNKAIYEIICKFLTTKSCEGVQVLLNDAILEDSTVFVGHEGKLLDFKDEFSKMENFEDYFLNELECLTNLIMNILKNGSYEDVKELLGRTAVKVIEKAKKSEVYLKFEEYLISFLTLEDLKMLVMEKEILLLIIKSELDIEVFEGLIAKLEDKFDQEYIKELLKSKNNHRAENIMYMACNSPNKDQSRIPKFLEIIQKYLTKSEVVDLMSNCNQDDENVLHICIKNENEEFLKIFWSEIQKLFDQHVLKNFVAKKSLKNHFTILHYAAESKKIEVHQTLWNLIHESFKDREELKGLILQKNQDCQIFMHLLVASNNCETKEFTFKALKENLSENQFKEILMMNDKEGQNSLQIAIKNSIKIKVFQNLWQILRDSCKSDKEFIEVIRYRDINGNNIIHLAVSFASHEVFKFIVEEFEKIMSRGELRNIFHTLNNSDQNLLQLALKNNKELKIHESLWKIVKKYFDFSEVLELIHHEDIFGNNIRSTIEKCSISEIFKLFKDEIEKFIDR